MEMSSEADFSEFESISIETHREKTDEFKK